MVPVPNFPQFIGQDRLFRPSESMKGGLNGLLDELHKWAGALKTLRPDKDREDETVRPVATIANI